MKSGKKNLWRDAGAVVMFRAVQLSPLAQVEIPVFASCHFLSAPLFYEFQSSPCLLLLPCCVSPFLETPLHYEEASPVKESTSLAPANIGQCTDKPMSTVRACASEIVSCLSLPQPVVYL